MKTYQYVWAMIRYRPWLYLLDAVLWALIHLSPVVPGLLSAAFFDSLSGHAAFGLTPWSIIVGLLAFAAARVVNMYYGFAVDTTHRFLMSTLLRANLLNRVLELPGAQAISESPGEAISRLRDDPQAVEDSISLLLDVVGHILFAGTAVAVLVRINTRMTVLVFVPLVLVALTAHLLSRRVQRYRQASREATARVTGAIGEIFAATQAVQLAGAEGRVVRHLGELGDARRRWMLKDQFITLALQSAAGNTIALGTGLVLILGARSMQTGQFTVGDFGLFVYYISFVADFTDFFGRYMAMYQQAAVSFRRMVEMLQGAPPERLVASTALDLALHAAAPDSTPAVVRAEAEGAAPLELLEATGLTYRYAGTSRGVEGVNLRISKGTFTVITGRIGSGKTTLLRTLLGLLPAQAGEIRWNDRVVAEPADFFTPPRAAFTAQIPVLLSGTVQENILLGRPEGESLDAAVQAAVLERDLAELEHGLDTLVGSRGVKLSGGQVQRVAAARMFVREPDLLVFDDLSSALDVQTERLLWERVFARPGATCLVVSHRRAALRRADHIIVLTDGQVEDEGTLADLLERCPEMQRLWQGEADDA